MALLVLWFLNRNQRHSACRAGPPVTGHGAPVADRPARARRDVPAVPDVPGSTVTGFTQTGTPTYVRPRNPRKRGPILFWATLALIAIGIGTLGVIDVAGTDVPEAGYPALAMALTGAMLVLGAFWGRAGGLILVGWSPRVATLGATASSDWDGDRLAYSPDHPGRGARQLRPRAPAS